METMSIRSASALKEAEPSSIACKLGLATAKINTTNLPDGIKGECILEARMLDPRAALDSTSRRADCGAVLFCPVFDEVLFGHRCHLLTARCAWAGAVKGNRDPDKAAGVLFVEGAGAVVNLAWYGWPGWRGFLVLSLLL